MTEPTTAIPTTDPRRRLPRVNTGRVSAFTVLGWVLSIALALLIIVPMVRMIASSFFNEGTIGDPERQGLINGTVEGYGVTIPAFFGWGGPSAGGS